jgi:hypothetical protein
MHGKTHPPRDEGTEKPSVAVQTIESTGHEGTNTNSIHKEIRSQVVYQRFIECQHRRHLGLVVTLDKVSNLGGELAAGLEGLLDGEVLLDSSALGGGAVRLEGLVNGGRSVLLGDVLVGELGTRALDKSDVTLGGDLNGNGLLVGELAELGRNDVVQRLGGEGDTVASLLSGAVLADNGPNNLCGHSVKAKAR